MARLIVPSERQEQTWLVDWLKLHPVLKDYFHKTNNEGQRTPQQTFFLKRMGLRPGVSDIFIYYPTKTFHGLWLEIKRDKKYTPSERNTDTWKAQEKFIENVRKVDYAAFFCYGFADGIKIIKEYLSS